MELRPREAPLEVLIPMMLARHCGLRGQTVVNVNRKQIVDHDLTGKAMRYYAHGGAGHVGKGTTLRCTASGYPTPHGGCAMAPPLRR